MTVGIPDGHPLLGRVVADSVEDRTAWHAAHATHVTASQAAKFAKASSVETYVRSALIALHTPFTGNTYTANGNRWEETITRFVGVTPNSRLFRHPTIPEFAVTPDGVEVTALGDVILSECKVKHKPTNGPTPAEQRQVQFQQFVMGALFTKWAWLELDPDTHRPMSAPRFIVIEPDPEILDPLIPIAFAVRDALTEARRIMEGTSV